MKEAGEVAWIKRPFGIDTSGLRSERLNQFVSNLSLKDVKTVACCKNGLKARHTSMETAMHNMGPTVGDHAPDEPALASSAVHESFVSLTTQPNRNSAYSPLPPPTQARLDASLNDSAFDLDHFLQTAGRKEETVLYRLEASVALSRLPR